MNTVTLKEVSDDLHRKLVRRAAANRRSLEAEALCCLQAYVEGEEELANSIPIQEWAEIERSVCETIHDQGTPLTEGDFRRYMEMARGGQRP